MKKVLLCATIGLAQASFDSIATYSPGSQVTDHNAIDRDQLAFENLLDHENHLFTAAETVYRLGGNSRSQVDITFDSAIGGAVATGVPVYQAAAGGTAILTANTRSARVSGDTTTGTMRYPISDTQASYVSCISGTISTVNTLLTGGLEARAAPNTDGCFHAATDVCIGPTTAPTTAAEVITCTGGTRKVVTSVAHSAGRTIRGFTGFPSSNPLRSYQTSGCPGCPYKDFLMFYNYYGDLYYSNTIVQAGLDGTQVTWPAGSPAAADFPVDARPTLTPARPTGTEDMDKYRIEIATKGTVYLTIIMYAIREFEDAMDDCEIGEITANDEPVHAWDEGVAFYTGSYEGASGTRHRDVALSGVLFYNLADYRCQNFYTCVGAGPGNEGQSSVNSRLFRLFSQGQTVLQMGRCSEVRPIIEDIVNLIRIPLIQGTLRYVYRISNLMATTVNYAYYAEGGIFAAAVVPVVHHCSATAATTIATNINLGSGIIQTGGGSTDFAAVKAAFESVYGCMNITCADVGGFWNDGSSAYYDGASPCTDPAPSPPAPEPEPEEVIPTWAIAIIATIGALFVFIGCCFAYVISMEKQGKPIFVSMSKGGAV